MMPLKPRVVDLMPFSATLQWDPPSDNGGSSLLLTYTVTLTNTSTALPFSNITATSLPLPNATSNTTHSTAGQCRSSTSMAVVLQLRAPSPHQTQVSISHYSPFTVHVYKLVDNDIRKYACCDRCDPILFLQSPSLTVSVLWL